MLIHEGPLPGISIFKVGSYEKSIGEAATSLLPRTTRALVAVVSGPCKLQAQTCDGQTNLSKVWAHLGPLFGIGSRPFLSSVC